VSCCSSCLNGGTCVDGISGYSCRCPGRFTGSFCQTPLWPCDFRPCLNNATCSNNASFTSLSLLSTPNVGYHCHCLVGFTGPRCESVIDWCNGANVPCRNGGTCRQVDRHFECLCMPGWTGTICDVKNVSCDVAKRLGEFTFFLP